MTSLPQKLQQLRLSAMSRELDRVLAEASSRNLSLPATLEWLADLELESRDQRAIQRRFQLSRLHTQHGIDQFHFQHHKSRLQIKSKILHLLDLDFIRQGTNVVLIGNPGTGKTFLAKILGWRACQSNHRVLFTPAMDMLNHLLASQADHSLVRKLKLYTDPAVLICDELGYLSLDRPTCSIKSSPRATAINAVPSLPPTVYAVHRINGLMQSPFLCGVRLCGPRNQSR